MGANTVRRSPNGQYICREGKAGAAGILPGYILDVAANSDLTPHATADGIPSVLNIADLNISDAGTIETPYADNTTLHYVNVAPGQLVTLVVGASQTIAAQGELASAGDGTVKSPAVAGTGVLFIAEEAVTTGVGETANIKATVANLLTKRGM